MATSQEMAMDYDDFDSKAFLAGAAAALVLTVIFNRTFGQGVGGKDSGREPSAKEDGEIKNPGAKRKNKKKGSSETFAKSLDPDASRLKYGAPAVIGASRRADPKETETEEWECVVSKKTMKATSSRKATGIHTEPTAIINSVELGDAAAMFSEQFSISGGAQINLTKSTTRCTITGTPQQVKSAVELVRRWLQSPISLKHPCRGHTAAVIGRSGTTLQRLSEESGAKVEVERVAKAKGQDRQKGVDHCKISGTRYAVSKAMVLVDKVIEQAEVDKVALEKKIAEAEMVATLAPETEDELQTDQQMYMNQGW